MFSRGKEKHRECDQSVIIGDIPIPSSPKHSCSEGDHIPTGEGPEKERSFHSKARL